MPDSLEALENQYNYIFSNSLEQSRSRLNRDILIGIPTQERAIEDNYRIMMALGKTFKYESTMRTQVNKPNKIQEASRNLLFNDLYKRPVKIKMQITEEDLL